MRINARDELEVTHAARFYFWEIQLLVSNYNIEFQIPTYERRRSRLRYRVYRPDFRIPEHVPHDQVRTKVAVGTLCFTIICACTGVRTHLALAM